MYAGKLLMAFAERTTAKKAPNFFLCVASFNRPSQAFYRKCGYTKVGKIEGLIRKGSAKDINWKRLSIHNVQAPSGADAQTGSKMSRKMFSIARMSFSPRPKRITGWWTIPPRS